MRMDRMIETLLSLGLLAGAGYLVVTYVLPKLAGPTTPAGGGCTSGTCSGTTSALDYNPLERFMEKLNDLLDDDSDEGTRVIVQEAQSAGVSPAGIGGLLTNASNVVTATTLMLQRQLGSMFLNEQTTPASGGRVDTRWASAR